MDVNFVKNAFYQKKTRHVQCVIQKCESGGVFRRAKWGGGCVQNMAGCVNVHCWGMSQTLGRGINSLEVWITPCVRLRIDLIPACTSLSSLSSVLSSLYCKIIFIEK